MPKKTKSFRGWRGRQLANPERAANYLNAAFKDSPEAFLVALRNVSESRRMARVAEDAGLTRESLYRALSEAGNPRFSSLVGVLAAVGVEMRFQAIDSSDPSAESSVAILRHGGLDDSFTLELATSAAD
jgi:probable addiction module antidote protein